MNQVLLVLSLSMLITTLTAGVVNPPLCLPAGKMIDYLRETAGKEPAGSGILGDDSTVVLFIEPPSRKFAIVRISNNLACDMYDGDDWADLLDTRH